MTSKLKGKIPKKQQVYNKFLFDSHMDILRAAELQEKEIAELKHVFRLHGEAHMAQDLLPQFTELVKKVEKLEGQLRTRIEVLEKAKEDDVFIVEQLQISRSAEMLYENEANKRLEGLENRLSRVQDMIAEMHKEGFIPVKQPQRKSPVK